MAKRVSYFYDPNIGGYSFGASHIMKPVRISMVDSIVRGQGLYEKLDVVRPVPATIQDLSSFHSMDYLQFLRDVNTSNVRREGRINSLSSYGLCIRGSDCPVFNKMFDFCQRYTGGTLSAARKLVKGEADICLNWAGGFHHAKVSKASGFCYVNDAVIGIKTLLEMFPRILYLDTDIHHGDSVEQAFVQEHRVMTVSFHRYEDNFFPGTGSVREIGEGVGRYYALNVPLRQGIGDHSYVQLFKEIVDKVLLSYQPQAICYQAGADSIASEFPGSFNLSIKGHAECLRHVRDKGLPLLVVGGGGYNVTDTAKCWAFETAVLLGVEDEFGEGQLPESAVKEFPAKFQPPHELHPPVLEMEDSNSGKYLSLLRHEIMENLRMIGPAPSVQMMLVPPTTGNGAPSYDGDAYSQEIRDLLSADLENRVNENNARFNM